MKTVSASAPLSVRNVLLAIGELDAAGPEKPLPPFATDAQEGDRFRESIGSMLGRLNAGPTYAGVRATLLGCLSYALGRDGLPGGFAQMAIEGLNNADPEACGRARNRIQQAFDAMAAAQARREPVSANAASSKRVGALPAGCDFEALGWSRLGTSSFWRNGRHVGMAKPGLAPTICERYKNETSIIGLKVVGQNVCFRLLPRTDQRDNGLRCIGLGQGASLSWVHDDALRRHLEAHFQDLDARATLRASGFTEVSPGIFELTVHDEFDRYDVLALVDGDRISGVYKSQLPNAHPLLRGADFRVASVFPQRQHPDELGIEVKNEALGLRFRRQGQFFDGVTFERPLESLSLATLGVQAAYLPHPEATGFIVGGVNSSATIHACATFNGHAVEAIEEIMRPGSADTLISTDGFLAPHQRLRDEMVYANDIVAKHGSTHQDVAKHLRYLMAAYRFGAREVEYHGVTYRLRGHDAMGGPQSSPFRDGSGAGGGFYLSAVGSKEPEVLVSPTAIDMIERWGFYEGRGLPWHVNPEIILEILAPAFASDRFVSDVG